MADEKINLQVTATTANAMTNIRKLADVMNEFGKTTEVTSNSSETVKTGMSGLSGLFKQFFNNASMGTQGATGFAEVIGSINPLAGAAAMGVLGLAGAVSNFVKEAIPALSAAQGLVINLESLAAQELVKAGEFETAGEALDTAKLAAAGLLKELQKIGLESPFENKVVVQTFQQGMAYGFNAEQAMKLTRASLDMAAGLGKSGSEMTMIGMVMGQMRSTGKLLTQDLRQLQSRGINVADMLKNQLGVSVEEFNAGLQSGKYSMDDLLDVFSEFAQTNFAGAAERMSKTWTGIQATLSDLKETAYITLLKQPFDKVTAVLADGLDVLKNFIMESGVLEAVGARVAAFVDKIIDFGRGIVEYITPAIKAFTDGVLRDALEDASFWMGMITANLKQIGQAIMALVKPAFDWLVARIRSIDWTPMAKHLQDTVNAIGQIILSLTETIRRLLSGNAESAMAPLRQAIVYTLTWIVVTWDRFAAGAVNWGWNLVVQVADGIIAAARSVMATAMNFLGNMIGLFIKPGSPPKKGPLSHIVEWGRGLINTFVQSFKTADFGMLKDALSPIQQALQAAVGAGAIDEAESQRIFGSVREDVAGLIAIYRQTGEISDEVLGNIAGKLGEGGEELTKYLRLQLQFQKAQDALGKVSEEVASAQSKGFVPKELAAKLKAAQATADAAKDELDWQKEYLGMQKDSVDIQLQLVKALEKLNQALTGSKEPSAAKEPAAPKGGAGTPITPEFTSNLMEGLEVPAGVTAGMDEVGKSVRGVSEEFQKAREKVDTFVTGVENFFKLPFGQKIEEIAKMVGLGDELEFIQTFLELPIETKLSYIKNKIEQLTGIDIDKVLEIFDPKKLMEKVRAFVSGLPAQIAFMLSSAWNTLVRKLPQWTGMLWSRIVTMFNEIMLKFGANSGQWGTNLGNAIGTVLGFMFNIVFVELPKLAATVIGGIGLVIFKVAEFLFTEGPRLAASWWDAFKNMIGIVFQSIVDYGPDWAKSILEFLEGFIIGLIASFIENGPEWYKDLAVAALEFINTFKQGVSDAWDLLTFIKNKVLAWIVNILFNFATWVGRLTEVGKTFIDKIKEGVNTAWDMVTWIGGKISTMVEDLIKGAGETLAGLERLGSAMVDTIKSGVTSAWDFGTWLAGMFGDFIASLAPGGTNGGWLDGMFNLGGNIIDKLKRGITASWENFKNWWKNLLDSLTKPSEKDPLSRIAPPAPSPFAPSTILPPSSDILSAIGIGDITGQIGRTRQALSMAGVGINVSQTYEFGDVVFPNVKDGRDSQSIVGTLAQLVIEGKLKARTRGKS